MYSMTAEPAACRYDIVSLGKMMLRLGEGRIRTARSFCAWEGGGEYNVTQTGHAGPEAGAVPVSIENLSHIAPIILNCAI